MRTLRSIVAMLLLAAACLAEQVTVTLLATTDLHGNIYPVDYYTGEPAQRGLALLGTVIEGVRRENPNTVLIDCGDTIQGTPLESVYQSWVSRGRLPLGLAFEGRPLMQDPMMLAMNALSYQAMTLGNHEFNFGLKNLNRAREDAHFPWLSANTAVEAGAAARPFDPYTVIDVGGARLAVIGVTTPSIPSWEKPENYAGYRFEDPVKAVREAVARLRASEKPDIIVVAAHMGMGRREDGRENQVYGIATGAPGVDAIVFGHTHERVEAERIGDVLVVQPKNWGYSLARIDFTLESKPEGGWKLADKRSTLLPASGAASPHKAVYAAGRPYHDLAERYLNTPVAESGAALDAEQGSVKDSALVDAVHAVQLHYAKADVSFTALFNPRARAPKGQITVRQIAALYPYENELYAIEGDGKMVKDALENAARFYNTCPDEACSRGPLINRGVRGYNYDTAQGVEYEVDLRRPAGDRIVNLRRNGKPLAPAEKLRIALNNYRAGGSAGYTMYRGAKVVWRSSQDIRDMIVEYYTERKRLPEKPDGNWRVTPPEAERELEREAKELAAQPGAR